MQDNLDDILNNVSDGFFTQNFQPPFRSTTQNRTASRNNANNNTGPMRYINRQLDTLNETIIQYNVNMLQYQRNMSELIRLLNVNSMNYRLRLNENRRNPQVSPITTRQTHNRFSNSFQTPNPFQFPNLTQTFFNNWNQSIFDSAQPQGLTEQQINERTNIITFNDQSREHLRETRCPISLENFQNGDRLTQIIGCGHVFLQPNLVSWFRRSRRCPICRYDLSTNQPTSDNSGNTINNDVSNNLNPIMQNLEQDMLNLMQSFFSVATPGVNYDISINTIPFTQSFTFTTGSSNNPTTTIYQTNEPDDDIDDIEDVEEDSYVLDTSNNDVSGNDVSGNDISDNIPID